MTDEDLPEPGATNNEVTGDAANVFQGRDVRDVYQLRDVYFVNRPAPPAPRRHPARMLLPFLPHVIAAVLFGSLAAVLAPRLGPVVPAVLVLILYGVVAVSALALLLAAGMVISPPRLWDGYAQRDGIVLAVLLADLAGLSAWQLVRRRRGRHAPDERRT